MPDDAAPHTVFVSHAHADNELCDRYVAALRARGLDVWYDRINMRDGHFLSDQISEELERRTAFVVLYTPASVDSFWVKPETRAYLNLLAQDSSRLLLPVRIAECKVPVLLQTLKYIDAV
ncbi:MAG: toll/interleukin-1 receptor domain-containing protein, partial [Ktedonobacterales bacterium]